MRDATPVLLGLDLGTRECRAVLVTPEGRILHVARRTTPTRRTRDGGAIHPPAALVAAAEAVIAECAAAGAVTSAWAAGVGGAGGSAGVAGSARPRIAAIGIAGMAEAGVALDGRDRPVGELLAWHDPRPAAAAREIAAEIGPERLFAITGTRPQAKHPLARLRRLAREEPAAARRVRRWAGVPELVGLALTGRLGTNASLAARTQLFDVRNGRWDPELVALADIADLRPDGLPVVLPFGRPIGGLRAGPARRLGMRAGIPVVVAGHDHVVAGIAAGATRPGRVLDSMGSAEMALLVTRRPALDDGVRRAGFSTGTHALDGLAYVAGGLQASGALIDWFVDGFLGGGAPGDPYGPLLRLLAAAPAGPTGLVVRPYLRGRTGPAPDPSASLDITGLREQHGAGAVAQALLESTAFHVRWMLEELARLAGTPIHEVRVVGGGTRNRAWLRVKAAVSPWPLRAVTLDEAVAVGAAIAAGAGVGIEVAGTGDRAPLDRVPVGRGMRRRYDTAYREAFLPAVGDG